MEEEANKAGLIVRNYKVIYKLVDDIKEQINSKLPEIDAEEVLGTGDRNKHKTGNISTPAKTSLIVSLFSRMQAKQAYSRNSKSRRGREKCPWRVAVVQKVFSRKLQCFI